MFLGEYEHSLDAKGRVILPVRMRARLAEGCIVTKGLDGCLYVYPPEEWQQVTEQLREARLSNAAARNFTRLMFSGASEQTPDRQGRVMIPEPLRKYAGLDRDVTILGLDSRIEIWDRAAWETRRAEAEQEFNDLAESNPNLPF
ncbi:MAG: division/cell wall cluster transcriptional repressor MraZ [Gemmatimonadota bacterium]